MIIKSQAVVWGYGAGKIIVNAADIEKGTVADTEDDAALEEIEDRGEIQ